MKGLAAMRIRATGGLNVLTQGASGIPSGTGGTDALQRRIYQELRVFTDWLSREGARGYIGEVNWPNNKNRGQADAAQWNALGEQWCRWADAARLWVTVHSPPLLRLLPEAWNGGRQLPLLLHKRDSLLATPRILISSFSNRAPSASAAPASARARRLLGIYATVPLNG